MSREHVIHAGLVVDATARYQPGALQLRGATVLEVGPPGGETPTMDLPGAVVMPGLVNAHCHLDLSDLEPRPYEGSFVGWIDGIRRARAAARPGVPDAVRAAVSRGAALSRAGGVALVGDVAGASWSVARAAAQAGGLRGVSYAEVIGIGKALPRAMATLGQIGPDGGGPMRTGISPHAPYSCAAEVYQAALSLDRPLVTHLAETREEVEFVRAATGPLAEFLRTLNLWDASIAATGLHPVDALAPILSARPVLAAHLNYVDDRHLEYLAAWGTSVAYCPRASAYFGHTGHRYRDMLAAGVNVALGTDGLPCLDTPDRLSVLDDMRLLHRRDGTDASTLLRMATLNGARALGADASLVTFAPGREVAGVLALSFDPRDDRDPLVQVLHRDDAPVALLHERAVR